MILELLLNIAFGYLLGSIPSGLVAGYLWLRRDIRETGSGKTGATNVLRTAGPIAAAFVMIVDIGKGALPGVVGLVLFDDAWVAAAGAGAAVVGHVWPVFAGFRGGRGVATTFGGILGLTPLLALVFPLIAAAILLPFRIVSLMSVLGSAIAAAIVVATWLLYGEPAAYAAYAVFAVTLVEIKHLPNIRRLLTGTEPRLGQGGDRPATG
ncbi:MAG: glycerol-3-phosphate 1-O-acyltransferase PlsY [Dehalococcoidia bacterium]|nr:glycerol-3-phosphate 1-O-acyltransferase PlsY [Dehalococcoidia bacterium]